MLAGTESERSRRTEAHERAVGRWENEGGAIAGWSHPKPTPTVAGEIGDAEAANLRVRLIALENVVVALLAGAPESCTALVRDMADYISPRPGTTPHRLTIEAARKMTALAERADQYRQCAEAIGQD